MRPADELYVGAWGSFSDCRGYLTSLEPLMARDARSGVVIPAPDFTRLPTDPNTPHQVRPGSYGFLHGHEGHVKAVLDCGTIIFTVRPSGPVISGEYDRFRPFYASNH